MSGKPEWWEDFFLGPWGELQARGYPAERTSGEADFLIAVLGLGAGQSVLDVACGIGRHSIELSLRGMDVTGVDFNNTALALAEETARSRNVQPRFVQRDMRHLDWHQEFNAAFCFYSSFGYFENEADDLMVASRVAAALRRTALPYFRGRKYASILSARQYVELIRDNIALAAQLFQQENWPN
jgi:ubiquinone/menaquinone biosynthesis C-methylase UbiE